MLETTILFKLESTLTQGRDVHEYQTKGRNNDRTGKNRMVVFEYLPSQVSVHFLNGCLSCLKMFQRLRRLKLVEQVI